MDILIKRQPFLAFRLHEQTKTLLLAPSILSNQVKHMYIASYCINIVAHRESSPTMAIKEFQEPTNSCKFFTGHRKDGKPFKWCLDCGKSNCRYSKKSILPWKPTATGKLLCSFGYVYLRDAVN